MDTYNSLVNMHTLRAADDMRDIYESAVKFRNQLRKALKTTRKASLKESPSPVQSDRRFSDVSDGPTETDKAIVLEYLNLTQEFIKNCMPEEVKEADQPEDDVVDPSPASQLEEVEELKEER